MSEKDDLIAKITAEAEKEAQKQKLNETQAKLYITEEVKKALEKFDETQSENKTQVAQPNNSVTEEAKNENKQKTKNVKKTQAKEEKYIVYTPVKNYNGEVAGVQFAYGKAEVKPGWILAWFIEHGYKVEEVSE